MSLYEEYATLHDVIFRLRQFMLAQIRLNVSFFRTLDEIDNKLKNWNTNIPSDEEVNEIIDQEETVADEEKKVIKMRRKGGEDV